MIFFSYNNISDFLNIKFIHLTSAGTDRIDEKLLEERGIVLLNAKGVYSIPISEYAISQVLSIYKNLRFFSDNQKKHKWEKERRLLELTDKNVCIIGCGSIGNECAKRFSSFGCNVYGIDSHPYVGKNFLAIQDLNKLNERLHNSDITIICVPLNNSTFHLINNSNLSSFKKNSILINVSRGAVINTGDLIQHSNRFMAIVLDVFENEPLKENDPIWDCHNFYITPHISYVGDLNNPRLFNYILRNLKEWITK